MDQVVRVIELHDESFDLIAILPDFGRLLE
jgi:hypothetical protein